MSNRDDDEPFLSRWARRKRDVERAERSGTPAPVPCKNTDGDGHEANRADGDQDAATAPAPESHTGEPVFDLSKLPKIEDLTSDSNVAAFLDKRVPAALRNAALSRMWTIDPTIRDFIEVAENQWNWNVPGGAPFYELMEPGTGASTIMADATSAIGRPIGAAPGEIDVGLERVRHEIVSESDKEIVATTIQGTTDNAAVPMDEADPQQPEDEKLLADERSPATGVHAAAQHEMVAEDPAPRRRHGGAIPS